MRTLVEYEVLIGSLCELNAKGPVADTCQPLLTGYGSPGESKSAS